MDNINYSKKIRKYIIECYALLGAYLGTTDDEIIIDGLKDSFSVNFKELAIYNVICANRIISKEDIYKLKPLAAFSIMQMYTDYYRYLKYQDVMNNEYTINFLNFDSMDQILWLYNQENISRDFYDATFEYYNSSAYDKILLEKCLDDKDRIKILKINPFYEYEMKKNNVSVDLDLIEKQIEKWQKSFPNNIELSYRNTALFLLDLYRVNKDEVINILAKVMENLKNVCIVNYSPDSNNYINYNGNIIDDLLLESMLEDYYDQKKSNTLIKKIGD